MESPGVDSFKMAQGRREAHHALDRLFDSIRDGRTDFGRALLEVIFQHGAPVQRRLTIERTERARPSDVPTSARGA
jgi:hypothetical protein